MIKEIIPEKIITKDKINNTHKIRKYILNIMIIEDMIISNKEMIIKETNNIDLININMTIDSNIIEMILDQIITILEDFKIKKGTITNNIKRVEVDHKIKITKDTQINE
jgi:hypothetical protein